MWLYMSWQFLSFARHPHSKYAWPWPSYLERAEDEFEFANRKAHAISGIVNSNVYSITNEVSMYSILIFDLEKNMSRTLRIWIKIGDRTYFVDVHMYAKMNASRSSRLFAVHFLMDIRTCVRTFLCYDCTAQLRLRGVKGYIIELISWLSHYLQLSYSKRHTHVTCNWCKANTCLVP